MSDFITIKAASNLFNVSIMTLHGHCVTIRLTGCTLAPEATRKHPDWMVVSCIIIWLALAALSNGKRAVLARSWSKQNE
jgi:hypothetical protein